MTTKNANAAANTKNEAKGNSEAIGGTTTAGGENKQVIVATAPTKADKARAVFDRCYGMETVPARKDIIKMAMDEAGLTKPGAATYLQNYKTKKGLSKPRATAATA